MENHFQSSVCTLYIVVDAVTSIPADVEEVRGDTKEEKRKTPKQKKMQLTDKDYEEMPTENLDWEKIGAEEKERMKDWARRKEKELVEQASELQFRLSACYFLHHSICKVPLKQSSQRCLL